MAQDSAQLFTASSGMSGCVWWARSCLSYHETSFGVEMGDATLDCQYAPASRLRELGEAEHGSSDAMAQTHLHNGSDRTRHLFCAWLDTCDKDPCCVDLEHLRLGVGSVFCWSNFCIRVCPCVFVCSNSFKKPWSKPNFGASAALRGCQFHKLAAAQETTTQAGT